ncbi:hypothetical protein AB431_04900 [Mycobacterium sp. EPa45]|nr:hypothetical protein AB431_04900 [Mycobacterium sp. EPa45]
MAFATVCIGGPSDLERLSARFSFRDLPDFLDIACRGDLSDIVGPSIGGLMVVPVLWTLRRIPETGMQSLPIEFWLSRKIFRSCTRDQRIGIADTRVCCPAFGALNEQLSQRDW